MTMNSITSTKPRKKMKKITKLHTTTVNMSRKDGVSKNIMEKSSFY